MVLVDYGDPRRYKLFEMEDFTGIKAFMIEKQVKGYPMSKNKVHTSGIIFVPKRFINQRFLLLMVPEEDIGTIKEKINDDMKIWK